MEHNGLEANDVQSQVLQTTLTEVAARAQDGKEDGAGTDEAACCVICLDVITEACEAHPCKHDNFDYLCLDQWLQGQSRCPLCKATIEKVTHGLHKGVFTKEQAYPPPQPSSSPIPVTHPSHIRASAHVSPWTARTRQRPTRPPRPAPTEDEAVLRRRQVYRDQLFSLHVGTNRASQQYRQLTPDVFQRDEHLVSRARLWLRRELKVFAFLHTAPSHDTPHSSSDAIARRRANNAEFLLEYIVAILKTVDTQGSQGQAEDMLQEFLGRENTRLLLHELRNFLRGTYSLEAWDRHVQYPPFQRKRRADEVVEELGDHGGSRQRRRVDSYRPQYGRRVGSSRRAS